MLAEIKLSDFTDTTLDGEGVFDTMMRANKAHLVEEYNQTRIKGTEYATVYLGSLQTIADRALDFLLRKDETYLRNQSLQIELERAAIERDKAQDERALIQAQTAKVNAEIELTQEEVAKVRAEVAALDAQADKTRAEIDVLQGELDKLASEVNRNNAQSELLIQQASNAIVEGRVLEAQECKLKAEFNLIQEQIEKVKAETNLLAQKRVTETAQTNGAQVAENSVLGRQIKLYGKQADGFDRDAEQKAAQLFFNSWNVRRTTDEATSANADNGLLDTNIGRAADALLRGINA